MPVLKRKWKLLLSKSIEKVCTDYFSHENILNISKGVLSYILNSFI
jgi:hypothetical protein